MRLTPARRGPSPATSLQICSEVRAAWRLASLLVALWLAGGSLAPVWAAKGTKAFTEARQAELQKDYDKALERYDQALQEDPENQIYMLAARRMRFVAGQTHVDRGHRLLDQGKLEEAAAEFAKAIETDPASSIAEQELRRTRDLIAKRSRQKKTDAAPEPGLSPLAQGKKDMEELLENAQPVPTLKPLSTQPINLKASNDRKVIFETIGKLAGINVLFDSEMQGRRVTVELNNATLQQALDYVGTLSKSFWKPLSLNAIFVTDDNTTKRRDYEDSVVKTFYLVNVYTAQELQEIATAVRSVPDVRRVFTMNSLNAMIVRASPDQMAVVEKVINDVDKARGEVIIDVLVLEVSRSRTRELGLTPVSGGAPGINIPIGVNPVNAVAAAASPPADAAKPASPTSGGGTTFGKTDIVDFSLNIPSAAVKALLSRSDTRVLQSPRVRGFDNVKASLRIGDRIPIATGSFQPGIGGVGINPLVNTQFNYQDVGVVLDLLPRVHLGKEVSMHVEIEISNVRDRIDIGGISQPIIGQRKIIHDIRLKEGESSIIGGLNQSQTTKTVSGVPLLSQIPLLGRLFSSERVERAENEILIVLLPHVVRVPELTDLNMKEMSVGTDQIVKVNIAPVPNDHPALPPVPAPAPEAPAPAPVQPAATPATPQPGQPAPAAPQPGPAPAATAPPATAEAPGLTANRSESTASRLRFDRPQVAANIQERFVLNLAADNVTDLFAAPLRVSYNPKVLHLVDARKGPLLSSDGQDIIFSKNIQEDMGDASINISRFPGAGGVSGGGVLLTLEFQGVAPGKASVNISNVAARNTKLETMPLGGAQAEVVVK